MVPATKIWLGLWLSTLVVSGSREALEPSRRTASADVVPTVTSAVIVMDGINSAGSDGVKIQSITVDGVRASRRSMLK